MNPYLVVCCGGPAVVLLVAIVTGIVVLAIELPRAQPDPQQESAQP